MEEYASTRECERCNNVGFDPYTGFYYCSFCGLKADEMIEMEMDPDYAKLYKPQHRRRTAVEAEPPLRTPLSQFWQSFDTHFCSSTAEKIDIERQENDRLLGPSEPSDFGSSLRRPLKPEDYYSEIRMRYIMGIQITIQMQCEALVEKFQVSPLICGLSGMIWLRYLASTRVLGNDWADTAIYESEAKKEGKEQEDPKRLRHPLEPHNLFGDRAVMIWFRSLRKTIPLHCSLAVCFLCCHIAREAVLPTDILKWSLEGKLPYFAAFVGIGDQIGPPSNACPIDSSQMFRPSQIILPQKLEALAASIAQSVGLSLPPVNFEAIASRYLRQLSFSGANILSHASRISQWAMPSELWLSTNADRLASRVFVMSILIVATRILYDLHGYGLWEMGFLGGTSCFQNPEMKAASELLHSLDARYDDIGDTIEFAEDLPKFLRYVEDVIFPGSEAPPEDYEEQRTIKQLREFYLKAKDSDPTVHLGEDTRVIRDHKKARIYARSAFQAKIRIKDSVSESSKGVGKLDCKEKAVRRLKADMEENNFCYIPPRVNIKRSDYLSYVRKEECSYVVHADYYILLRACARVAQVDIQHMHLGVLSIERRLAYIESRIDHCLKIKPPAVSCEFCKDSL